MAPVSRHHGDGSLWNAPDPPDPDRLFEQHSVEELTAIHRSLRQQMEGKREELRTMVGERYRDLIEAADTINTMKTGARHTIQTIQDLMVKSKAMSHTASLSTDRSAVNPQNVPYLTLAAEIKCLMMCPEKIWTQVDQRDYLQASQLYLFARHTHTGLTMDQGGHFSAQHVANVFPVVGRQWASIAHFRDAILQGAKSTLIRTDSTPEACIGAMLSRALIQGFSASDLFEEFLQLRKADFKQYLQEEHQSETAKGLMARSLGLILSTLTVIHQAFRAEEGVTLASQAQSMQKPTLDTFETKLSPVLKYLPPIVSGFKPSLIQPLKPLETDYVQSKLRTWLDEIHELVNPEIKQVMSHISGIGSLISIRRSVYELLLSKDPKCWDQVCRSLLGKELNLWDEFFRSVFRERIEALIASQIAGSVYCVQSTLSGLTDLNSESDLSAFLWSESQVSEIGLLASGPGAKSKDGSVRLTGLELKARGYSPRVLDLCEQFDGMLKRLLQDVKLLIEDQLSKEVEKASPLEMPALFLDKLTNESVKEPFLAQADNEAILLFLEQSVQEHLDGMITHIGEKYLSQDQRGLCVFLARFYQALPEISPNLEKSVLASKTLAPVKEAPFEPIQARKTLKVDPQWGDVKEKLELESCRIFRFWITALMIDLKSALSLALRTNQDPRLLHIFGAWETIEISEQGEESEPVKSTIKVPQAPSIAFICALGEFCHHVYNIAPYSLPTPVQMALSQEPCKVVTSVYTHLVDQERLNQNVALQLLFDLQFMKAAIISTDNKPTQELAEEIIQKLEANHIDPFDLRVFLPYISVNVKKSILKEQGLLSVLIPNDRFTLMASMKSSLPPPSSLSNQENHNLMWTIPPKKEKIPLIPIPKRMKPESQMSSLLSAQDGNMTGHGPRSVSPVLGRRKRDKSPVARAAGSFFEAMSTSWFGSK
ncbi:hypothetical protein TCAL_07009 [Tigriopus californicus]|uniref:Conserved oligomeric Golgi complex subunit 1 n=1 Tax=Tigriopus californicus TaxID=6832 RepID=A0A553PDQ4_TIGCA|nr:conserved oligomeric Golgi complex subunit 1-like [Tigriopus californicus]TRY75813.1 hypothetical protein TCAL_07009 [Tigriopus californicus]